LRSNVQLFAICVTIWGTTWLAIKFQLGHVPAEASVAYRFFLASMLIFAYCAARRLPLRYPPRQHAWLALQGVGMFGASYVLVYLAEERLVSGLVAVGFSASPLLGMLGMRAFFGTPMTRRLALGSVLGMLGIALVFWPEFAKLHVDEGTIEGVVFTALAVVIATFGSLTANRNHKASLPLWQSMAWGMLYGSLFSLAWALASGKALVFEATAPYVLSLLYLAILGSVIAFASFITLLNRIGAARSGYVGVMVPIVALVISAAFESFHWHVLTWVGVAISVAGNVVILRERRG
jgi:drug/metabolite transporter (DMT)-like permease